MNQRIALGTVQFGLRYGIANQGGQVALPEATAIVRHARERGLDTLDTAVGYGDSERRLGEIGIEGWNVISKLPAIPADCNDVSAWAHATVDAALARLGVPSLYGLLMHQSADLLGPRGPELREALQSVRAAKKARRIGVSVYGPDELDALAFGAPFDLVQAPFNVIDRRLATSGWLDRLNDSGIEVHVRSVFLQGLLLMDPASRPRRFARWDGLWKAFDGWARDSRQSPLAACLGFAMAHRAIGRIVVGVDSLAQLREILESLELEFVAPPETIASTDPDLIIPSRWSAC
jgi:aryl-alcohol dehydrogenase-like predicted oxidoreductase